MSSSFGLATLNAPPLVASAGAVALACLPSLEQACVTGPWAATKVAHGLAYGLNLYATSQPGRIDGVQHTETKTKKDAGVDARTRRGRTLLVPSGWAFSIWAPIFAGELVFCLATLVLSESAPVVAVIKQASGGFILSQVFQALWSAAFRPNYTGKRILISGFMLSGIAVSLSRAHGAFSAATIGLGDYLIYFFPMALHFGWTTAAALVNWNGNLASLTDNKRVLSWAGHVSAVAAGVVGVGVTLTRRAPVFGGVIAWALTACSEEMKNRLLRAESVKKKKRRKKRDVDEAAVGIYGAKVQQWLCAGGAVLSGAAALFVTFHTQER